MHTLFLLMSHHRQFVAALTLGTHLEQLERSRSFYHPKVRRLAILHPREDETPWNKLYSSKDEDSLVAVTGVHFDLFEEMLVHFKVFYDTHSPYMYAKSVITARRFFDAAACLGLVLAYISSEGEQKHLSLQFGGAPSTLCTYLRWSLFGLHDHVLPHFHEARIAWPNLRTMRQYAAAMKAYEPDLRDGGIGVVDGLNCLMHDPGDVYEQNAYYNGWLGACYCSNIFVFAPDGRCVGCLLCDSGVILDRVLL